MKHIFPTAALYLATASLAVALAQPAQPSQPEADIELNLPPDIAQTITPAQIREAAELGQQVVRDILDAYNTKATEADKAFANETRRRVDLIADEAMEADRQAVLDFLGIDPESDAGLYYFVSWSMPLEVLRSYAIEAMWAGGTLVFKGIPPGRDLGQFLTQDLRQLVYGKGAGANISIDPRLYDAYAINAVPTIVFTKVRHDLQCQGLERIPVRVPSGEDAAYDTCPPLAPENYWKLSGAVTSNYALQSFIDDGAVQAAPYLNALSRGWAGAASPGKEQRAFSGKWEDVLSPSDKMAAEQAGSAISDLAKPTQ